MNCRGSGRGGRRLLPSSSREVMEDRTKVAGEGGRLGGGRGLLTSWLLKRSSADQTDNAYTLTDVHLALSSSYKSLGAHLHITGFEILQERSCFFVYGTFSFSKRPYVFYKKKI